MPAERVKILFVFTQWLPGEELTEKEMEAVIKGEKEIKKGHFVRWQDVKRIYV